MSRFHSYIASATQVIRTYLPGKPLSLHLKSFFAADKKYGSKDRKVISSLCYAYFRTGKVFANNPVAEKILMGLFLCENKSDPLLRFFRPDLDEQVTLPLNDKLAVTGIEPAEIFPFGHELGGGISEDEFGLSFLVQPAVYLRTRPGRRVAVADKLAHAAIKAEWIGKDTIRLDNNVSADKILKLNKDAVVQDLNSQQVFNYLHQRRAPLPSGNIAAWDCCAASGGKSILLYDKLEGKIQLTVSDIRDAILYNLGLRLQQAGVPVSKSFVTDLSQKSGLGAHEKFNIIIADVPCTGSGTWSRSPEQLFFFEESMIAGYAQRQQSILSHVIPHLETGGLFFYITCSVFKRENEALTAFIHERQGLKLLSTGYLKGYQAGADTMFVAVFSTG